MGYKKFEESFILMEKYLRWKCDIKIFGENFILGKKFLRENVLIIRTKFYTLGKISKMNMWYKKIEENFILGKKFLRWKCDLLNEVKILHWRKN